MSDRIQDRINSVSVTPGLAPPPNKLNLGQIGINLADGKLYIKLLNGSVISVGGNIDQINEAIANISQYLDSLLSEIEGKAENSHKHNVLDIDDLEAQLEALEAAIANIPTPDLTDYALAADIAQALAALQTAIDGKQPAGNYAQQSHGHGITDIAQLGATLSALQNAIEGKHPAMVPGRDYPIISPTPPNNPQDGWQWTQSGNKIDWYYDASNTRWLSRKKYRFVLNSNNITNNATIAVSGHSEGRLIAIDEMIVAWSHPAFLSPTGAGGVASNSNYWTVQPARLSGAGTYSTFGASVNTQGLTCNANEQITLRVPQSVTLDMRDSFNGSPANRFRGLAISFAKTGATALNLIVPTGCICYRWIYAP